MIFKSENRETVTMVKAKGGEGEMKLLKYYSDENRPQTRFAVIAVNTLNPGCSLGYHVHTENEELYLILEGTGLFTDNDRQNYEVNPGDLLLTCQGQGHALLNNGDRPLIFAAIIADSTRP